MSGGGVVTTPKCPGCGWCLRLRASEIVRSTRRSNVGQIVWDVRCWNPNCKKDSVRPEEVYRA